MQARGDGVGDVDGDPGGAVTQSRADQARPAPGTALLLGQLLRLVLLGDLRREDVENPAAEHPQLPGTEVRRFCNQMRLGPREQISETFARWAAPPARG